MNDCTEKALGDVRSALASLEQVPAAALAGDQHEQLRDAAENVQALEKALTNKLEQKQEPREDSG